jgi:DNA-binding response OmpR family regulator
LNVVASLYSLNGLTQSTGKLMIHVELLTRVDGFEHRDDMQILRTWVSRLRHKIEMGPGQPPIIRTIPETGYMIDQSNAWRLPC